MKYDLKLNDNGLVYVFLHGWGLNRHSFKNIISCIGQNVNYINFDLYGFGESLEPKDYFDVYEYAYQIFLLLKKMNINNIVLVGHSFGGRLSIILSSLYNIEIKKMFLTSSAGVNRFSLLKCIKIAWYKFIKCLVRCGCLNKSVLLKYGSDDYKNSTSLLRGVFVKIVNQDLTYLLKYIDCDSVLVWDKKDNVTPYWMCKRLSCCILFSKIILYSTGGHFTAFVNFYKFSKLLLDGCDSLDK